MEDKYADLKKKLSNTSMGKPNTIVEICSKLFQSRDIIHLAHLKTTSYAQHIALNEYYDGILEFADNLVETAQGCEQKLLDISIPASKAEEPLSYLLKLKEYICSSRDKLEYEFQKNIIDEVTALIASTCYKLKFLK
jgi:hypothetical protein